MTHFLGSLPHEHESLCVGDDLGGVESLFEVINELLLVAVEDLFLRTRYDFASADTLLLEGRQTPGENGLSDQGNYRRVSDYQEVEVSLGFRPTWNTGIEGSNSGPFTGTLLPSGVENLINHGFTIVILELEDVCGDVNQERVKDTLIPLEEDIRDLIVLEIETVPEDVIGLSNQLHVTVFNAWVILSTGIIVIGKSLNHRCEPS